jgi:hypothetical protein
MKSRPWRHVVFAANLIGVACTGSQDRGAATGRDAGRRPKLDLGILPDYDNAKSNTGGIAGFVSRTGVVPIVVSNFMNITDGSFSTSAANAFIDEALAAGIHRVSISLATADSDVPAAPRSQIAASVIYGAQKGIAVQVRFGYEMNGKWSPSYHGGDPTIFKATWAEVAGAVHGAGGQMVWAPNVAPPGSGISAYPSVLPDDTSTVDVIGLDFYHFNSSSTDLSIDPREIDSAVGSIYPLVERLNKPFILSETGVSYFDDSGTWATATAGEASEKRMWLEGLTSGALLAKYPRYRGFTWFDYNKYEMSQYRDFSLSEQQLEAKMFSSWVSRNRGSINLGR